MRSPWLATLAMLAIPVWVPTAKEGWVPVTMGAAVPAMASGGGDGGSGNLVGKAGCRAQGSAVPCGEGAIDPTNVTDPINVIDPKNDTDPTNVIDGGSRYGVDYGAAYGVTNGVDYGVSNGTGNGTETGTELSVLHRSLLAVLATLLISAAAPLGSVLLLCGRCPSMQRGLLQLLLALGAGALSGDAMLHLLPQFLELHTHEEAGQEEHAHEHTRVQPWQLVVVLAAILCFFLLERSLRIAGRGAKCWVGARRKQPMEPSEEGSGERKLSGEQPPHSALSDDELQRNILQALPLLLTLGDAVHNAADGVALGAAFSVSWRSGVGTAVAVLLHELPHELGDMAALLRSGLSAGRAVLLNAAAALPALVGVGAGLAIGTDAEALRWVCGAAAGIFLYVALCDIMPALLQERSARPWLLLGLHCLGLISGWAALAGLALLEDSGAL